MYRTFCLRHATHAVILRVMSGGFRSPNDSRKALTAGGEGSDISISSIMQGVNRRIPMFRLGPACDKGLGTRSSRQLVCFRSQ